MPFVEGIYERERSIARSGRSPPSRRALRRVRRRAREALREHGHPAPGRGDSNKVLAGHEVVRPSLLPLAPGQPAVIRARKGPDSAYIATETFVCEGDE
jgi:hypothetical protein